MNVYVVWNYPFGTQREHLGNFKPRLFRQAADAMTYLTENSTGNHVHVAEVEFEVESDIIRRVEV